MTGYQVAAIVTVCTAAAGLLALQNNTADTPLELKTTPIALKPRRSVRLLVLVPTVQKWQRAQYVRNAYASMKKHPNFCDMSGECPFKVRLMFVVGDPNTKTTSHTGDTLTVKASDADPAVESGEPILVSSTTTKLYLALQWAARCMNCYDYVLRQGDDAHVNLLNLFDRLTKAPLSGWVLGRFAVNTPVAEPWLRQHLMLTTYPPYPYGMGFVMTMDVAEAVAALRMPTLCYPEDAMFGIWLLGMTVVLENSKAFHNRRDCNVGNKDVRDSCKTTDILTHYMQPADWAEINPFDFSVKC